MKINKMLIFASVRETNYSLREKYKKFNIFPSP